MQFSQQLKRKIVQAQTNEITEYYIYKHLSKRSKNPKNKKVLSRIAEEEYKHYQFWMKYSGFEVKPNKFKIFLYTSIVRLFGLNFGAQLMERGEEEAQDFYNELKIVDPQVAEYILRQEEEHEREILALIDQKYLQFAGSFVLGLSDAIVELSGAIAGLTLALKDTNLIGMVGLITGIAASMSMAGSEYLSTKEEGGKEAGKASLFTGVAYISAVIILILPFLLMDTAIYALIVTLALVLLLILLFTFYTSVAKNINFKSRFLQMAAISLGVAIINFFIGMVIRGFFGVE